MAGDTRLRYQLRSQGAVWAHLDASRSHVLIDPRAEIRAREPEFVRPIELWRATRWKRPPSVNVVRYPEVGTPGANGRPAGGPDANGFAGNRNAANEADQPPGTGETINLSSTVDFISDLAGSRLGALGALIDAVAAALEGGPPVVLAAPNADQGARWIGAVSFFTPPAVCLRLSFSTHERWDDVI